MSALFLSSAAIFGLLVILPVYYRTVRGESPLLAGLLVAPLGLGAIVTTPPAGRLVDRRGPRGVAVAGLAVAALGLIAYTRLPPGVSPVLLAAALPGADTAVGLTAAFADSLWWAPGLAAVAIVPAALVPARSYRRRAG